MSDNRRPAVATILAMSALVLEKAADDMAAGKLDPAHAVVLAGAADTVAFLLRDHARTSETGHPRKCAHPTRTRPAL